MSAAITPRVVDEAAPAPGEVLLRVQGLKKYFPIRGGITARRTLGFVRAVDGVDLEIRRGKSLGLIGESGCGKTTVGRCVLQLLEPTDGKVEFGDRVLFDADGGTHLSRREVRAQRKEMQIVFQDPFASLNPRQVVSSIVGEGVRAFRRNLADRYPVEAAAGGGRLREQEVQQIVAELLQRVGLNPEHLYRFPHEFSGGQRQRICVARALALKPSFIVLDEPTSALDVSVQAQILNLLKDLQRERGLTYMFISHHLSVIRYMCDDVAVMYLGKIVEKAGNEELFENPRHPYTIALLSAIPAVDVEERRERIILEGDVPSPANPPSGCRFHTRCMFAVERETQEVDVTADVGAKKAFTINDPRAVARTLRLAVSGQEFDALAVKGDVAFAVHSARDVGLEVQVHMEIPPGAPVKARYRRFREACAFTEPELVDVGSGHTVACHFHTEVTAALRESQSSGRTIGEVVKEHRAPLASQPVPGETE